MKRKVAIITGANSGIGFQAAKQLSGLNYNVILACRDIQKGMVAKSIIEREISTAAVDVLQLDLASFDSIRSFGLKASAKYPAINLLINNAGVMVPPKQLTEDGFELQFGVNYLSHFLLTGLLLKSILKADCPRIITVSSFVHKWGKINFDDINFTKRYHGGLAYRQSKLACLLFSYELHRRFSASGINCKSIAAHPGIVATNLARNLPAAIQKMFRYFFQPPDLGSNAIISASVDEGLIGGEYVGPNGLFGISGSPVVQKSSESSYCPRVAAELWQLSEQLTCFKYEI